MNKWFLWQTEQHQQIQHLWLNTFQQFSECILLLDEHYQVLRYNQSWQNFIESYFYPDQFSLPLQAFRNFKHYIYPNDLYVITQQMQQDTQQSEQDIRLIYQEKLFWFRLRCQPVHDPQYQKYYYYFFLQEQTQQMKETALRLAHQRGLDGLLQRLPMMLYRSRNDRNWTMEYVNEGCQQVIGYLPTQLINSPLYGERIHPDDADQVWFSVQQALDLKKVFYLSYRWIDAQQNIIYLKDIGQGLYSASDMVLGVEGLIYKDDNVLKHS
ncbi:PAS domain-containing protein [Acinetobacter qingfengensis]|uniref:PAS domain-containing protein n=1 Tax=Acinetobacter qingfengensis TaxID=1262585 RepID=A0A1E7RCR6_9GAMM|nr:PAS domain-containing protein [Acinetobacter qingfengensis]KAA8735260.1 PAS domain-containing protein [Acinetobacter qingfengensis]OEY96965.1 hypothetical protein BJI46_11390 [Acinetobacter qingfengensis]